MKLERASLRADFEDCEGSFVAVDNFGGGKLRAEVPSSLAARTGQLGALVHVTKAFLPSWNAKVNLGRFRLAKDSRALSVKFAARSPSEPAPSVRVNVLDASGDAWIGLGAAFNLTREWQTFTREVAVPGKSLGSRARRAEDRRCGRRAPPVRRDRGDSLGPPSAPAVRLARSSRSALARPTLTWPPRARARRGDEPRRARSARPAERPAGLREGGGRPQRGGGGRARRNRRGLAAGAPRQARPARRSSGRASPSGRMRWFFGRRASATACPPAPRADPGRPRRSPPEGRTPSILRRSARLWTGTMTGRVLGAVRSTNRGGAVRGA